MDEDLSDEKLDAELAGLEADITEGRRELAERKAMDEHCTRCGRDCSDGQYWTKGDPRRIVYCIACITPEERATVAAAYRKAAREAAEIAAEHGLEDFERDEADRMRREAERIERGDS